MLLSDWLLFFHKTIIALSGGHFEYFLSFPKKITLVYGLMPIRRIPKRIRTDGFSLNALRSAPSLMALLANFVFATLLANFLIRFKE